MTMTQKGLVMGTPAFMSPEQILGNPVDGRSDIFSVGIILYTFLTFQNPFAGEHVSTVLYKITSETPEPIRTLIPNCPPELDSIIQKALAKRREERYQTAEDMAFDLQRVADSMSRDMVEIYVREGQKSFAEGNLTLAKESLQRVLEVDSDHNLAKVSWTRSKARFSPNSASKRSSKTLIMPERPSKPSNLTRPWSAWMRSCVWTRPTPRPSNSSSLRSIGASACGKSINTSSGPNSFRPRRISPERGPNWNRCWRWILNTRKR